MVRKSLGALQIGLGRIHTHTHTPSCTWQDNRQVLGGAKLLQLQKMICWHFNEVMVQRVGFFSVLVTRTSLGSLSPRLPIKDETQSRAWELKGDQQETQNSSSRRPSKKRLVLPQQLCKSFLRAEKTQEWCLAENQEPETQQLEVLPAAAAAASPHQAGRPGGLQIWGLSLLRLHGRRLRPESPLLPPMGASWRKQVSTGSQRRFFFSSRIIPVLPSDRLSNRQA